MNISFEMDNQSLIYPIVKTFVAWYFSYFIKTKQFFLFFRLQLLTMVSCKWNSPPALLQGFLFLCSYLFSLTEGEKHCCSHLQKPLPLRLITNKDSGIFLLPYSQGVHLDVLQKQALLVPKISPINQNQHSRSAVSASSSSSTPK